MMKPTLLNWNSMSNEHIVVSAWSSPLLPIDRSSFFVAHYFVEIQLNLSRSRLGETD